MLGITGAAGRTARAPPRASSARTHAGPAAATDAESRRDASSQSTGARSHDRRLTHPIEIRIDFRTPQVIARDGESAMLK
jgi:hypothetical protein